MSRGIHAKEIGLQITLYFCNLYVGAGDETARLKNYFKYFLNLYAETCFL